MIKQWIANWFFKNVKIFHHDATNASSVGHTIFGIGWRIDIPSAKLVSTYSTRTPEEHRHIRESIQKNPATCRHLKGGRIQASGVKDYNVSQHTFIDGSSRIRCLSCGRKWINTDPDWKEAVNMVERSTNGPTSSEVLMLRVALPGGQDRVYQNKEALKAVKMLKAGK